MQFTIAALVLASSAVAAPFSFPIANGFPILNTTALQEVYKLAGGTLPNGPLPTKLSQAAIQTLQVIAVGEIFEVAYFTSLIANITTGVPGYEAGNTEYTLDHLTAVVNQEQVHALAANGVLANAKATTILPCSYNFPVTDFISAISVAETFTDVALGSLPLAQQTFATDAGDEIGLVPIIGSIVGQEGEQNGYYRFLQDKSPASSAPLLTAAPLRFAYTAVSGFIVPGSCPNIDVIGLTPFPALTVETIPKDEDSVQLFSVEGNVSAGNVSIAYINGQNIPVTVPISDVNFEGGRSFFFAEFPYDAGFARGLTIGALVQGTGNFSTPADVAAATLNGPALIVVD